ncbi:hypothetical protein CCX46_15290 [Pseudomonas sp. RU47]|nr:hypothetical protein CCX46_15290 [Pseudomonas sp. RU47]
MPGFVGYRGEVDVLWKADLLAGCCVGNSWIGGGMKNAFASRLAPTGWNAFQNVGASLLAKSSDGSPQQLDTGNMTALPAAHVLRPAE